MFDRLGHIGLGLFVSAASAAAPVAIASAQARPTNIDSLHAEVRRLDSLASEQGRIVDSVRKSLVRAVAPVSVRGGALEVRTFGELESQVRLAADSVARLIDREGGPSLAARVAAHVPVVRPDSARAFLATRYMVAVVPDTSRRSAARLRQTMIPTGSVRQLEQHLVALVEQFAAEGIDSTLAAWLMTGRIPLRPATVDELGDAYTELATAQSAAIRRCRSGENAACMDVLGIDTLPGARLERWYSPEDYRTLLITAMPPREDSAGVAAWTRCRDRRDENACRTAAAALPNGKVPLPLSGLARRILLREVLNAGGPGAYERLVSAGGPVEQRMERAASQPLDVIVSRWRARIEGARPDRMAVRPTIVLSSLGWSGVLLGLTLIRRRPWV